MKSFLALSPLAIFLLFTDIHRAHGVGGNSLGSVIKNADEGHQDRKLEDDCSDFEQAYSEFLSEKFKNPIEYANMVCSPEATEAEDNAIIDPDAHFSESRFGKYAGCAKSLYFEALDNSDQGKLDELLSSESACRAGIIQQGNWR